MAATALFGIVIAAFNMFYSTKLKEWRILEGRSRREDIRNTIRNGLDCTETRNNEGPFYPNNPVHFYNMHNQPLFPIVGYTMRPAFGYELTATMASVPGRYIVTAQELDGSTPIGPIYVLYGNNSALEMILLCP